MHSISFKTKFGWISAFEYKGKLTKITFKRQYKNKKTKILLNFKKQIEDYINKKKNRFKLNLNINGNIYQKIVWKEISKIKYGQTSSYGKIAKKLKLSPRYVGKICGENKFVLAIPCHRVVRSDGSLGGYSTKGGLKLKKKILDFEKK